MLRKINHFYPKIATVTLVALLLSLGLWGCSNSGKDKEPNTTSEIARSTSGTLKSADDGSKSATQNDPSTSATPGPSNGASSPTDTEGSSDEDGETSLPADDDEGTDTDVPTPTDSSSNSDPDSNSSQDTDSISSSNISLLPIEDIYVQNGEFVDTNFNHEDKIAAKKSPTDRGRIAYLKFDINELIDKFANTDDINSALLKLKVSAISDGNADIQAYGILDDDWDESVMTWNEGSPNHTIEGYEITGIGESAFLQDTKNLSTKGEYVEFNVTQFIKDSINKKDSIISIMLAGNSENGVNVIFFGMDAKEDPPELIIDPD